MNFRRNNKMAFLGQLTANVQAQLNNVKPQLNSVLQTATRARDNLAPILNRATAQLDNLGKILQVTGDRKQSPIDILSTVTAFDSTLENSEIRLNYPMNVETRLKNAGDSLQLQLDPSSRAEFSASHLGEERYVLETVYFHWGTEPMNGSEHTIGGVGYAGEIQFIHRNTRFLNLEAAFKEANGILGVAVLLNESHDDNPTFSTIIDGIKQVVYKGSECAICGVNLSHMLPSSEKMKEFWTYTGSETIQPYRETVQWIIFRATIWISSNQLDKLRTLKREGYECEVEETMSPIRAVQPINGRIIRSSFRSSAQAVRIIGKQ
ncbi:eukaryotic-type carbonic anhydrase [Loa loa]|uniref:Eukaryotic-type carbonic anhydrase n=2 Tax=Loa loa TaxID=7209 RepID=A0A1S0U150_LOALO|nr:eukaryotic-type carbonic anhydrase [Loa loa]EFO23458.2 eukaryotic-type carbonic anhydrase [Loa loa]